MIYRIPYALNQERYLKVFLTDGDVPIDNNASERAIRGFCVGKKNWQVIDTINGADSSASLYSIAETAKANNLKPYDYFEYLLTELPKHTDDRDRSFLEDLLLWSEKLPEHIRKQKNKTQRAAHNCSPIMVKVLTIERLRSSGGDGYLRRLDVGKESYAELSIDEIRK